MVGWSISGVAQWLARGAHNPKVAGSNPVPATIVSKGPRWLVPTASAGVLLFFGLWVYASYWSFNNQARYSDMITVQTANALSKLPDGHAGIISNSFTMSLWVAALEKVPSPHVWTWEPPRAYTETDEDVRCILGWVYGCEVRLATRRLAVTHVLVEERFPKYNDRAPGNYGAPEDQWTVTAAAPWLSLVFSQGTTRMYEISAF